jgi:hypothetical protein
MVNSLADDQEIGSSFRTRIALGSKNAIACCRGIPIDYRATARWRFEAALPRPSPQEIDRESPSVAGHFSRTGFEPKLPGICLVSVLVLVTFAWYKVTSYQLLRSPVRRRPGLASPLKANENFSWKSGVGASESNTRAFGVELNPQNPYRSGPPCDRSSDLDCSTKLPTIKAAEKRNSNRLGWRLGCPLNRIDRLIRQIGPPFSDGSDDTVNGGLIDSNDYPSLVKPRRRVDGV